MMLNGLISFLFGSGTYVILAQHARIKISTVLTAEPHRMSVIEQ